MHIMAKKELITDGAFDDLSEEKKASLKSNRVVRTQIGRIVSEKVRKTRQKRKTPRQVQNSINAYFSWCEDNDRVPSINGMMLHMKFTRVHFYDLEKRPEYHDILDRARLAMAEWVESDIYQTPGQAAGKLAYAKNKWDWSEKVSTTNVNENINTTILTVEDARAKIAALAHLINPQLLEAVTSKYTLDQIAHIEEVRLDE
jgi:hypothetical protein